MAHPRNLILLLCALAYMMGLNGSLGHAQDGLQFPTFPSTVTPPPLNVATNLDATHADANVVNSRGANANSFTPSPWFQPNQGFDPRGPLASHPASYLSTYDLRQIDSARRTASDYRARSSLSPIVNDLALQNASLVDQWVELAEKINASFVRLSDANIKLNSATRDYEDVGAKLRQYGLTPTIGLLLSHKKTQLDDWQVDGSASNYVDDELKRSREKQLGNEMIQYDGRDVVRQSSAILALAGYGPTHNEYATITQQVQSLLRERNDWLRSLTQGYNDYRQKLGELDSASAAFGKLTDDYRQLINRHVTWIRSSEPLALADVRKFRAGLNSLFDSRRSEAFAFSLTQKWRSNPSSGWTLLGTIAIIVIIRILAKSWLVGKRTRMRETTASTRKCIASLLTPLVAFAFPSILY